MILNTRRLFCRLLRTFSVKTVCDVGSMDGADALLFRDALPEATIFAFEPNPTNYSLMAKDGRLIRNRIRILPYAASNRDSTAPFFTVEAGQNLHRSRDLRGMSSLYRRIGNVRSSGIVQVRTVQIATLLREHHLDDRPCALWIDCEGMGFEVVEGALAVLGSTEMVHIEVESEPVIGVNQKVSADVEMLLTSRGFELIATDHPRSHIQLNALFVRTEPFRRHALTIRYWLVIFWLRHLIRQVALKVRLFAVHRPISGRRKPNATR